MTLSVTAFVTLRPSTPEGSRTMPWSATVTGAARPLGTVIVHGAGPAGSSGVHPNPKGSTSAASCGLPGDTGHGVKAMSPMPAGSVNTSAGPGWPMNAQMANNEPAGTVPAGVTLNVIGWLSPTSTVR